MKMKRKSDRANVYKHKLLRVGFRVATRKSLWVHTSSTQGLMCVFVWGAAIARIYFYGSSALVARSGGKARNGGDPHIILCVCAL